MHRESNEHQILQREAIGPPIIVYSGAAGSANQIAITPSIPGLSATSVYDAILELNDESDYSFPFSFGDASPSTILMVKANQLVRTVTITILVPFNGTNSQLSVGDAGDDERLFPTGSVDPADANTEWEYNPSHRYGASTAILLFIVPNGATQGSGVVHIKRG
jgi:hypothetical protein